MENFKEFNERAYGKKIENKWKTNPFAYDKYFGENIIEKLSQRKNKHLDQRKSVFNFLKKGFPLRRDRKRGYSPDYAYHLVYIKKEEKRDMASNLNLITKNTDLGFVIS